MKFNCKINGIIVAFDESESHILKTTCQLFNDAYSKTSVEEDRKDGIFTVDVPSEISLREFRCVTSMILDDNIATKYANTAKLLGYYNSQNLDFNVMDFYQLQPEDQLLADQEKKVFDLLCSSDFDAATYVETLLMPIQNVKQIESIRHYNVVLKSTDIRHNHKQSYKVVSIKKQGVRTTVKVINDFAYTDDVFDFGDKPMYDTISERVKEHLFTKDTPLGYSGIVKLALFGDGFDWNNICIAGGRVTYALYNILGKNRNTTYSSNDSRYLSFNKSDIDLFLLTSDIEVAREKIQYISDRLRLILPKYDILIQRTKYTVSFYVNGLPKIQIILKLFKNITHVLCSFDVDSCCMAFDGTTAWTIPRGQRALNHQGNIINPYAYSPSYISRLLKYARRGFAVADPGFNPNKINWHNVLRNKGSTVENDKSLGLAKLLYIKISNELLDQNDPDNYVISGYNPGDTDINMSQMGYHMSEFIENNLGKFPWYFVDDIKYIYDDDNKDTCDNIAALATNNRGLANSCRIDASFVEAFNKYVAYHSGNKLGKLMLEPQTTYLGCVGDSSNVAHTWYRDAYAA